MLPGRLTRRVALGAGLALFTQTYILGAADAAVPENWVELTAGEVLTLQAPPGSRFVPGRGTDSFIGRVEGPGFRLEMDYGVYSDPLTSGGSFVTVDSADTRIDGKAARTVFATSRDPVAGERHFYGLHVMSVAPSALGPIRLTVTATSHQRKLLDIVDRIVHTIRFKSSG